MSRTDDVQLKEALVDLSTALAYFSFDAFEPDPSMFA